MTNPHLTDYRNLGRCGMRVSPLCLGTMMFGGRTNEADSRAIIDHARAQGVNFIDTADQYNDGESERVVGKAIANERDHWIVATKVANPMGTGPNDEGLSKRYILQAAEASLDRMGMDFVDIYYLHKEDLSTPLDETLSAVADLLAQGMIRHFGVSNFRSWRIAEIVRLCDAHGMERPVVTQPYYNMMNRMPEVEQLPVAQHYGLGIVPYSPLARGVLTGKYSNDAAPPADSRAAAKDVRILETEWRPESIEIAQKVKARAEAAGVSPGHFAVQWVRNNALVTSVLAGPRTMEQWEDYVKALDYTFTADDETFVDGLVAPGHPSTPGYTDPRYPLEGRVARTSAE